MRTFFQDVLEEALMDSACRERLVEQIKTLTIDPKLLQLVFAYAHGKPSAATTGDSAVRKVTLEQIIAGVVPPDIDDEL